MPAGACAPCIAHLSTLTQQAAATRDVLATETEPLVSLTHLLRLCRDHHPLLWERRGDPATDAALTARLAPLTALTPDTPSEGHLDDITRAVLAASLDPSRGGDPDDGLPAVVVAHALADWLDTHYAHTFADSFRRRSPYQPSVGDPLPLDAPDLRQLTALAPTAPPWRLANRLDQTRHVRLAGQWATQFRVVFDYRLYETLNGLIGPDTIIATCHPNGQLTEIAMPPATEPQLTGSQAAQAPSTESQDSQQRRYPIGPADPHRQHEQITHLLTAATAAGATIIVLPELTVTGALAAHLEHWVRRPEGPRLLLAGTYHHQAPGSTPDGSGPIRRNTALAWVRGDDQPLRHDKYAPADHPVREDTTPDGWPELRVYVTSDGWHLAIVICRDLLDPTAVHALCEAGVNLLLVPAMSETLMPFGGPAAQLVGCTQALVAIANNPADWSTSDQPSGPQPAHALFGHPGYGQLTRRVPADPEPGPGVALLSVHSGQLAWHPAPPIEPQASPDTVNKAVDHRPGWTGTLAALTTPSPAPQAPSVSLRTAAVLVLLRDTPTGPRVLLTRRTPDLADYPGQLVFPGGATDPTDSGPVATALREATEEVGLDPATVHVIGCLPPHVLPESGFLVIPVLAWTTHPSYPAPVNLAEVDGLTERPLTDPTGDPTVAAQVRIAQSGATWDGQTTEPALLGSMTRTVLAQLRRALANTDSGTRRPRITKALHA
ncbi:MAG TPA: NUDIX domain-containing protein [Acidimicrobiales bacterium]|nr:NUDIX domain-containing protein [Acidimicrobiales bacterium]